MLENVGSATKRSFEDMGSQAGAWEPGFSTRKTKVDDIGRAPTTQARPLFPLGKTILVEQHFPKGTIHDGFI